MTGYCRLSFKACGIPYRYLKAHSLLSFSDVLFLFAYIDIRIKLMLFPLNKNSSHSERPCFI